MATSSSSSLCARLEKQLELLAEREATVVEENRRLMQEVAQKDTLSKKIENVTEARDKLNALWERVKGQYAELDRLRAEDAEEDRRQRLELSAELQERIAKMNDFVEATTRKRTDALRLNDELKRKIDIIDKSAGDRENIRKIFADQEQSTARAQEGLAADIESIPALRAEVEALRPEYETLLGECRALEAEVRQHAARFQDVERLVLGAHQRLKDDDAQRKRVLKKLEVAERELGDAVKRCEKVWAERDAERAQIERYDKQAKTLEAQIEKLKALTEMLQNGDGATTPTAAAATDARPTQHQDPCASE